MLKIYGWKRSRAIRCIWTMEELGVEYEQIPLNPHAGETRTSEYLALNPSGKIPTLVHDGFVLSETMAINLYLASVFPGSLLPGDRRDMARLYQWTSWALTELEPPLVAIMREGRRPEAQVDATRIAAWRADIHAMIDTALESHLARQEYMLRGSAFTLADLNVASVASSMQVLGVDLSGHPRVSAWMQRCFARPAWQRAQDKAV
jgi:glutathione S-transferase